MAGIGGENGAEAALRTLLEVELECVHALQVEGQAAAFAVDLETVLVLAARREAGGLDAPDGTVLEAQQRQRGVIHVHLSPAAAIGEGALRDEGLEQPADFAHLSHQVAGEVQGVGGDVPQRAGARPRLLHPPAQGRVGIHDPVLQVAAAEVADAPKLALFEDALGERHRR